MTHQRTAEYLYLLQSWYDEDVKIEAIETETEWGSTHYDYHVYIKSMVMATIKDPEELVEFLNDGVVTVPNNKWVFIDESLDQAITDLFYFTIEHLHESDVEEVEK